MGASRRYFFLFFLSLMLMAASASFTALAVPSVISDDTCETATRDGAIDPADEYLAQTNPGVNSGFGDKIGGQSELLWDSDIDGNLNFAVSSGNGTGIGSDVAVMYIDVDLDGNGFHNTFLFSDNSDGHRAAISGKAQFSADSAPLAFATSFTADYAIPFNPDYAGLFKLSQNAPHTWLKDLGFTSNNGLIEIDGLTISDLGLSAGSRFAYVVTLLNPGNAYRSNEFMGANYALGNPGNAVVTLAATDYSTFAPVVRPLVSVSGGSVDEDSGQYLATVSATPNAPCDITVSFSAADDTAELGLDYDNVTPQGQVVIDTGTPDAFITVDIVNDLLIETDEVFTLSLNSVVNGTLSPLGSSLGVVINDDDGASVLPVASILPSSTDEGTIDGPFYERPVTVQLSAGSASTVTVNVITETATADVVDFVPSAVVIPVTFLPFETLQTFNVLINPDHVYEDNEYFTARIVSTSGAVYFGESVQHGINNDDSLPSISIGDITEMEGTETSPDSRNILVPITLSNPSENDITLSVGSADGTATVSDGDFSGFDPGPLLIPALSTTSGQIIAVFTDNKFEPNESFSLVLTNPSGATLADDTGVVTLNNDDAVPTVSIVPSPADVMEGTGGLVTQTYFIITLSNPTYQVVSFDFETYDGTATIADNDYLDTASATYEIAAGSTEFYFGVPVVHDSKYEDTETFGGRLTAITNAAAPGGILPIEMTNDILNDDAVPTLTISGYSSAEGTPVPPSIPSCTFQMDLTLQLSNPTEEQVDVTLTAADGTATIADNDYELPVGSVGMVMTFSILPGNASQLVALFSICDDRLEADETFSVGITGATNASIGGASTANFVIENDDLIADLITDSGFENDSSDPRQGLNAAWVVTNGSGDKVRCDDGKAYSGACSFTFKGGLTENSQLSQTISADEIASCPANEQRTNFALLLQGMSQGSSTPGLKFKLFAWDAGNVKSVLGKGAMGVTSLWVAWTPLTFQLDSAPTKLKLSLYHKSVSGKKRIDEVHLYCGDTDHFRGAETSPATLPPPAAPSAFRRGG